MPSLPQYVFCRPYASGYPVASHVWFSFFCTHHRDGTARCAASIEHVSRSFSSEVQSHSYEWPVLRTSENEGTHSPPLPLVYP